ncbi:MAG: hypothetical protein WCT29_00485 [Candidatus Paceibacterota bacterium]|jgi:hypothetical protein
MRTNTFDKLSLLSLFFVAVLLPIFCLPFTSVSTEISKGLLLVVGLTISVVLWAVGRFFDGKITIPKSWLLATGGVIVLITLISALFSQAPKASLFGVMFDLQSFFMILAGFVLMFMFSVFFRTQKHARMLLFGIILSSAIVLIFQSARLFMPGILSLGIFSVTDKTANVIGTWNSLGLFAGFSALMFLLVIEFFSISKLTKILLQVFILLAVLLAAAVNFTLVWMLLGLSSLIIFVYKASASFQRKPEEETTQKHFPVVAFVVVMVSLVFLTAGPAFRAYAPEKLKITNNIEVGPSLSATLAVGKNVIVRDPILGIGPNKFSQAWSQYKPLEVNSTVLWDVPFDAGSGLLPTIFATNGILGLLPWLAFLGLFLFVGGKSVFSNIKNGVNWEMMAFFVLSLYLFITLFLYATGVVMLLLFLAFTGVFVGLATGSKDQEISILFLNDHRKSFFSILALILVVIASIAGTFRYFERFASVPVFRRALMATELPVAETAIKKAISMNYNDLYLRSYAQVYFAKFNSILGSKSSLTDKEKADLETALQQAIGAAREAVDYNPGEYQNYRLLGSIYETAGLVGYPGAYAQAVATYQTASELNPFNPILKLGQSRASLADGKREDAIKYAEEALTLAPLDKGIIDYVNSLKTKTSTTTPPPVTPEANN